MKHFAMIATLVALGGCATAPPLALNTPVGPAHDPPPPVEGRLVVYTFAYPGADYADIEYDYHTSYTIYTPDGKLVKAVDNQTGPMYTDPSTVHLPPGQYKIKAEATGGMVMLPVVIERDKTTVVDLDHEWWTDHQLADKAVELPNGDVIGAAAN